MTISIKSAGLCRMFSHFYLTEMYEGSGPIAQSIGYDPIWDYVKYLEGSTNDQTGGRFRPPVKNLGDAWNDVAEDLDWTEEEIRALLKKLNIKTTEGFKFIFPSNCGLYGMSQSGKTSFIKKLIEERIRLFKLENGYDDIHKIFYFYGSSFQPVFEELEREHGVIFVQGLPDNIYELFEPEDRGKPMMLIFDDLMDKFDQNDSMFQLVFKDSHHMNLFVLMTFQTLHPSGKFAVRIREQLHVQVFFRVAGEQHGLSRRFSGFATKQKLRGLMEFYHRHVTRRDTTGGYIIINNHPRRKDYRLQYCTNIFKDEAPARTLVPQ